MSGASLEIVRGRMTEAEMREVEEMAERGLGSGQIARRLNRHQATIGWAMHRLGLKTTMRREFAYYRNGVLVKSFSPEEDRLIEELRVAGKTTVEIAEELTKRFGHPRSPHTICMRLTLLANAADTEPTR